MDEKIFCTEKKLDFKGRQPIVILAAMECEFSLMVSTFDSPTETFCGGYRTVIGTLEDHPVIAMRCLVGPANAASAVTNAIRSFSPSCVIIQGTAGGHNPKYHKNDIILGKNIIDIGCYFSSHRNPGAGISIKDRTFPGGQIMKNGTVEAVQAFHSSDRLISLAEKADYAHGRILSGTIGSANAWNREIDVINFCHNTLGSDCEEMECFAAAQVCAQTDIPLLAIRIISNSELYPEEVFDELSGIYCQEYTLNVVREIVKSFR